MADPWSISSTFPQALANYINMLAVRGHFLGFTLVNNYFGHGLYESSTELSFRVLDASDGFVTERMALIEDDQLEPDWFKVTHPAQTNERGTLTSAAQSQLFVNARKLEQKAPFSAPPYQSDYVVRWTADRGGVQLVGKAAFVTHSSVAVGPLVPNWAKAWGHNKLFTGP